MSMIRLTEVAAAIGRKRGRFRIFSRRGRKGEAHVSIRADALAIWTEGGKRKMWIA